MIAFDGVSEIEHPFRYCDRSLIARFWRDKAFVVGWWKKGKSEDDILYSAVRGRGLGVQVTGELEDAVETA